MEGLSLRGSPRDEAQAQSPGENLGVEGELKGWQQGCWTPSSAEGLSRSRTVADSQVGRWARKN